MDLTGDHLDRQKEKKVLEELLKEVIVKESQNLKQELEEANLEEVINYCCL